MSVVVSPKIFISVVDTREIAVADTLLIIANFTQEETVTADTLIKIVDITAADTLRRVVKSDATAADSVIRFPHFLNFFAQVNTFKNYDVTNFEVTLNERTLSDKFSISTAQTLDINAAVKGQFLDYKFSFLVEETSQRDLIQNVSGMFDIDKLLYTHVSDSGTIAYKNADTLEITAAITAGYIVHYRNDTATVVCARASDMIQRLADCFNLTPNIHFADFTPYNLAVTTDITYADLISNLFGWTSRLPQRQINVFLRDGVLNCIQRGMETSTFDITDLPHSRPLINKKLLRTMYNSPFAAEKFNSRSKNGSTPQVDEYWEDVEIAKPFSGVISYSDGGAKNSLRYKNGLLISERHSIDKSACSSDSFVGYEYAEVFPEGTTQLAVFLHKLTGDFYLVGKVEDNSTTQYGDSPEDLRRVLTSTRTEYQYADTNAENIYLVAEIETATKKEYGYKSAGSSGDGETFNWALLDSEITERRTVHTPIGNGWYNTSVYVNGEIQGSSISQGKPGNKVSPYTINEVQKTLTRELR